MYWFILAQQVTGGGVEGLEFLDFLNLGVLAVLVVAFIKGWVIPGFIYNKTEQEKDEKEEELAELRKKLEDEMLPQWWKTTDLLARFAKKEKD